MFGQSAEGNTAFFIGSKPDGLHPAIGPADLDGNTLTPVTTQIELKIYHFTGKSLGSGTSLKLQAGKIAVGVINHHHQQAEQPEGQTKNQIILIVDRHDQQYQQQQQKAQAGSRYKNKNSILLQNNVIYGLYALA